MSVNTYTPGSDKPLVIYHSNCADGFAAAWCFWRQYGNTMEYFPGTYGKEPPDVTGREVFLVDFSYKKNVVLKMLENAVRVTLIDHHKTAIDDLSCIADEGCYEYRINFYWYTDIDRSGARLAWDYLYNYDHYNDETQPRENPMHITPPRLLEHIEDRDLWRFKLPLTREIQANVFSFDYTFESWDKLMNMDVAELATFSAAGAAIERKHFKDIRELLSVCKRVMEIGGYSVPVASLPYTMSSDAANMMAEEWEQGNLFAACYCDTATGRVFSLRSTKNGMDVSLIAKEYGGGGHKNAAGFSVPRDHELARS